MSFASLITLTVKLIVMIVYGVCKSCNQDITIATVQEVPQRLQNEAVSLSKFSCKTCGVSNRFKDGQLKIRRFKTLKKAFVEVGILGLLTSLILYKLAITPSFTVVILLFYVLAAGLYMYSIRRNNLAVYRFNHR